MSVYDIPLLLFYVRNTVLMVSWFVLYIYIVLCTQHCIDGVIVCAVRLYCFMYTILY